MAKEDGEEIPEGPDPVSDPEGWRSFWLSFVERKHSSVKSQMAETIAQFEQIRYAVSMADEKDVRDSFKEETVAANQFEQDLRCLILVEKYTKEDPVNGDRVALVDPLDPDKALTLN